ncbi:MAG: class II fructose-bisphosphate aldolase, partial [Bacteroides sp.]|nr:class II fructose-bisphosphate aldolase [Bacteroides sp.]
YAVHLDHGNEQTAREVILGGGFSSVMIDASHEPYEKNVSITRGIVELAHSAGMEVEAELGVLSGVEDDMEIDAGDSRFTRPNEVVDFVSQTGCDSLAIAIGTSHGAYKFKGDQTLQFHILEEIQKKLPGFPLVLHGGSAVDSREIKRINASGGKLKAGASGVPAGEISMAIASGVCKVNIATDARIVWTRVHREYFQEHPEKFDPLPPGRIYMDELEILYSEKFSLLGATNKTGELIS